MTTQTEALKLALEAQQSNEQVERALKKMTAHRAIYFMERFKHEEKLLGPNEQAALDFVIAMLESHPPVPTAQPKEPEQEPVAMKFKIYKPTVPDPTRQDINNALLPWVYDQDRSSGFDASMWVTPVATLPPQRTWVGLDDDEMLMIYGQQHEGKKYSLGRMVEAKLKAKNT